MRRIPTVLTLFTAALAACSTDSPLPTGHMSHPGSVNLSDLAQSADAQALSALRQLTVKFHDLEVATDAGYLLFSNGLTAPDGCISDLKAGGMGYHYGRLNNLGDDAIDLLDPEFLVYAPKDGPRIDGAARTRLAAFDYFIPYSPKWPAPEAATFKRPPSFHDFPTTQSLPDIAFAPSRFGGWMIHIWLWEHNPDGMFANFNTSVARCVGSPF
ncbi:MAG TPA: hypothetical protein VGP95_01075 [Gemmatimonadaceae bacterium]|nr:hypothetical protein [Gemmatimonadaceae bacterium]